MDRAEQWLYGRLRLLRDWRGNGPPGGVEDTLEGAIAGVDALSAAGVLSAEDAALWRRRLAEEASGELARPAVGGDASAAAAGLLEELLQAVPAHEPDWADPDCERFEGAVELLAAVGAVDAATWDARLRARTGRPSAEEEAAQTRALNAGGTEVELVAIRPGPQERRAGHRLLVALVFADGVSFLIDKDPDMTPHVEWPDWSLTDDVVTWYDRAGGGGGDTDEHISFRTAAPVGARWLELQLEGHPDVTFRIEL